MSSKPSKGRDETPRIVINDASCLIDLRKVELCLAMLRLPYRFVVTLPVKENELLEFTDEEWKELEAAGLEIIDLDGERVGRSFELRQDFPVLSAEDCFSLSLAESVEASILLTGDAGLREVAESMKIEVHGVLWIIDELHRHRLAPSAQLVKCLITWRDDPLVRLPAALLAARLRLLGK